jgi:hypothetical protein
MKPNQIFIGKPEGLATWTDYPKTIRLVRQIQAPFSNRGDWEAVSVYTPKGCSFPVSVSQIWTEAQIRATFTVPD